MGVTDALAVRGDYLLQPVRGFVPGYDFVGVVEQVGDAVHARTSVGQRVAGILPHMGAHATRRSIAQSLLVPVPDTLDPAVAATAPLDAVTARFALDALKVPTGSVLVQGAGGAVGAWATQLAAARGLTVFGTASDRTLGLAQSIGAKTLDYRNVDWMDVLRDSTNGGVDGLIDHTGNQNLHRAVAARGRIVRIAFSGAPGRQRRATAAGFGVAVMRRYAQPAERVVSTPMLVMLRRSEYRSALTEIFDSLAAGLLTPPQPRLFHLAHYRQALAAAEEGVPGKKTILIME